MELLVKNMKIITKQQKKKMSESLSVQQVISVQDKAIVKKKGGKEKF